MPKGFFTQGVMVLTEHPLDADAIGAALAPLEVVDHRPADAKVGWLGGQESWIVAYRPDVNGYVIVEPIAAPWPDHMGDPKAPGGIADPMGDVTLFAAWSMGHLGPHTYPGNLARARQVAAMTGNDFVAEAAAAHRAFVRIRSTYVLGAAGDAKVMPDDYDPRGELEFVTAIARAVAGADGALCYFNPGGETLLTPAGLDDVLGSCAASRLPPLPAWSAGRLGRLDDAPGAGGGSAGSAGGAGVWMIGDVVGMEQLLAPDHEAVFQPGRVDVNAVMQFLRSIALYTLDHGPVIETGHTTDGPGGLWRALLVDEAVMEPPRPAIRWYADFGPKPPARLLANPARHAAPLSAQPTPHRRGVEMRTTKKPRTFVRG